MKKLLREYWILLVILAIPYLFIVVSSIVKVKYDVTVPATITSTAEVISIGKKESKNINTVSVYSYSRVSFLNYLLAKINPYATISDTYEFEIDDYNVGYSSGLIQKKVSIYNAIIAGYKAAGINEIEDENSFKGYIIHSLYTYSPQELQIGDIITSFNGVKFLGKEDYSELDDLLDKIEFTENKEYPIEIERWNESSQKYEKLSFNIKANGYYTMNEGKKIAAFGIESYEYNIPVQLDREYLQFNWQYGDSIGPSGGLMQSLYVYESLSGYKLVKNLKIVGTGTVDKNGKAGPIGGIYQKIITANLCNVDIFFVPVSSMDYEVYSKESNYQDAIKAYNNLENPKMKLVIVSSLEDIINYLKNY